MKNLQIIFKNTFKIENIVYFLIGCTAFSLKYISKWELCIGFFFILAVINSLKKILKISISFQSQLKHLNWILIPLFIFSFFFKPRIIGLLMIAHFFSDSVAKIIRNSVKPFYHKYFPKNINGSLFFILSYYILSLFYVYFFDGSILKKYILIFLINSIYLAILENSFKIKNYPDNFNINMFGPIFLFLALTIDFKFRISSINLVFGLFWCIIPIIPLIILDIINLKKAYVYYMFFLVLYAGFGYQLFLFNMLILMGIGLIKKTSQSFNSISHYKSSFLEIAEIKEYFLLSFILVLIYFFIPRLRILKMSIVVGLTTALLHYFYHNMEPYISKKYIHLRKIKISREIFLSNIAISLLFLFTGYLLNLIRSVPLIYAFLTINIFMISYILMQSSYFNTEDNKIFKFLVPYFSFKIFFLFQIL